MSRFLHKWTGRTFDRLLPRWFSANLAMYFITRFRRRQTTRRILAGTVAGN
jgi:hypothetical protein